MITIKPNPARIWLLGFTMSLAFVLFWSLLELLWQLVTKEIDADFWRSLIIVYPLALIGGCLSLIYFLRNRWVIVMTPDKIIGDSGLEVTEIEYSKISQISNGFSRWRKPYKIISESGQVIPIHFVISNQDCQLIFETIGKKREQPCADVSP